MPANARIRTDTVTHVLDVRTDTLGNVGDFIHETNLGRQHRVGRVLGQLGRTHIHFHDAIAVAVERCIQTAYACNRCRLLGTDHDPVRAHAVGHRVTFLEELRVGNHVELMVHAACIQFFLDGRAHLVGGTDRHRGLIDDHRRPVDMTTHGARNRQHVLQVGAAVLVRRRAHGDEGDFAVRNRLGRVGSEAQPARGVVGFHHRLQARFIDGNHPTIETINFRLVDIHADNVMTYFRQTGTGDKTNIAGTKDRNSHGWGYSCGGSGKDTHQFDIERQRCVRSDRPPCVPFGP